MYNFSETKQHPPTKLSKNFSELTHIAITTTVNTQIHNNMTLLSTERVRVGVEGRKGR